MNHKTGKPKPGPKSASSPSKEIRRALPNPDFSFAPTPEQKQQILRARAQALARKPAGNGAAGQALEVVVFLSAYETYAVESVHVHEVYPLREFTRVPHVPSFVLGLINVRGRLLVVIDIKKFFDLPEGGLSDLNKVIIVQQDGRELGLLADAVVGVRAILESQIEPSLPTLTGIRADYLKGVTTDGIVILDAEKLMRHPRVTVGNPAETQQESTVERGQNP